MKVIKQLIVFGAVAFLIFGCKKTKDDSLNLDLLQSNEQGLRILDETIRNHGDVFSDSVQLSISVSNPEFIHPGQSLVPLPPFETYSWERLFIIDGIRKTEFSTSRQVNGGYTFEEAWSRKQDTCLYYNINTRTFRHDNTSPLRQLDLLPQNYLRAASKSRMSVKLVGTSDMNGQTCSQIDAAFGSASQRLWVDRKTGLLVKTEVLRNSSPYGDGLRTYHFINYRKIKGILIPSRVEYISFNEVTGNVQNTYQIDETASADSSGITDQKGFTQADYAYRRNAELVKLSENIYLIENITGSEEDWSYNVLFAEFDDYVLVTEAPVDNSISDLVIKMVKKTVPDKPIRYLVQSHHHNDHIGGIRRYMAEGVSIVTTAGNVELFNRISKAPFNLVPDELSKTPKVPVFELVIIKWVKENDSIRTVVYDIGPTAHAKEMLITYFPKHGILYQADMINYGEWSIKNELTGQLVSRIKQLGLKVNIIVGLHGKILQGEELQRLFDEY